MLSACTHFGDVRIYFFDLNQIKILKNVGQRYFDYNQIFDGYALDLFFWFESNQIFYGQL